MMPLSYRSPKTEVRESKIHGRGLFATADIAKDEVVVVKGGDPRRSILPDVEVKPALTDLLAGADPVMGKAFELARAGK